jgi:hypothetical protein
MADIALGPRAPQPGTNNPTPATLDERTRGCLARNDVRTCAHWLALMRRRFAIFGISKSSAKRIDLAIAEVLG